MKKNHPIKILRQKRHMSQEILAEKAETSQQNISLYETGLRTPSFRVWRRIAKALKLNANQSYKIYELIIENSHD